MAAGAILTLILFITTLAFLFDFALEWLNLRAERTTIPPTVAAFYPQTEYARSRAYHRAQTQFGFLSGAFSFFLSVAVLWWGGFGWLDAVLRGYLANEIVLALAFFGILALVSDLLTLPFQLYGTFVIEARFGFNKTTVGIFFADKLKGYVLAAVLGGALMAALLYLVQQLGPLFWLVFGVLAAGFLLLMNMFYASLVLPLFSKLTPLPDGELKNAIYAFANRVNFPVDNIFVMDGSKRSSKANAFFSGFGRKKKIVLYDTLLARHTTAELVAVLAHEVGHFKKKHIVWAMMLSILQLFFVLFVLSLMIHNEQVSLALGGSQQAIHLNLLAFGMLFSPVSGVMGLGMMILSRKNEYEADAYARQYLGSQDLATALKKLSVDSLSNLYPHPVYVFFNYSHPPLLNRLSRLDAE